MITREDVIVACTLVVCDGGSLAVRGSRRSSSFAGCDVCNHTDTIGQNTQLVKITATWVKFMWGCGGDFCATSPVEHVYIPKSNTAFANAIFHFKSFPTLMCWILLLIRVKVCEIVCTEMKTWRGYTGFAETVGLTKPLITMTFARMRKHESPS